jgi:hypothetical protein
MRFTRSAILRCCNAQTERMESLPSTSLSRIAERPHEFLQQIAATIRNPINKTGGVGTKAFGTPLDDPAVPVATRFYSGS